MAIKNLRIEEGCILCGLCEETAPDVFQMGDDNTFIIEGADINKNEDEIREAADSCPVDVILFDEA